jgi:hypothetical protein
VVMGAQAVMVALEIPACQAVIPVANLYVLVADAKYVIQSFLSL